MNYGGLYDYKILIFFYFLLYSIKFEVSVLYFMKFDIVV